MHRTRAIVRPPVGIFRVQNLQRARKSWLFCRVRRRSWLRRSPFVGAGCTTSARCSGASICAHLFVGGADGNDALARDALRVAEIVAAAAPRVDESSDGSQPRDVVCRHFGSTNQGDGRRTLPPPSRSSIKELIASSTPKSGGKQKKTLFGANIRLHQLF